MDLSIVMPAFNEEHNIEASVRAALDYLGERAGEVIVVNDGSRDSTGSVLDRLASAHPGRVIAVHHETNLGYTAALRSGFEAAGGEFVFYTDADNQFEFGEIDRLLALKAQADLVVGYRHDRRDPWLRKMASRAYNALVRAVFGLRGVRDIDCAFKLFRSSVLKEVPITGDHFIFDAEILLKARRRGFVIREVPVTHKPRSAGSSTVRLGHIGRTLRGLYRLHRELRS